MDYAIITVTPQLKSMLNNTVVGYFKVNKSWVHHNNSYECAAWWEDSEIQSGVYPLYLKANSYSSKELYLQANLNAVVVDDYFPALWGGVAVSRQPYKPKNVGQQRTLFHRLEIVDSIEKTGYSPNISECDVCVNPLIWQEFINAARDNLNQYHDLLDKYRNAYLDHGDGDYNTNLSMIGHCSKQISVLASAISKIKTKMKYLEDATGYMHNLHVDNTNWIGLAA